MQIVPLIDASVGVLDIFALDRYCVPVNVLVTNIIWMDMDCSTLWLANYFWTAILQIRQETWAEFRSHHAPQQRRCSSIWQFEINGVATEKNPVKILISCEMSILLSYLSIDVMGMGHTIYEILSHFGASWPQFDLYGHATQILMVY
jgi:hypothetical protein